MTAEGSVVNEPETTAATAFRGPHRREIPITAGVIGTIALPAAAAVGAIAGLAEKLDGRGLPKDSGSRRRGRLTATDGQSHPRRPDPPPHQ